MQHALQEPEPQVTAAPDPGLLYDYYGFPPESYRITYPAPGAPQLAQQVADLLRQVLILPTKRWFEVFIGSLFA